jgi:hypothetical protein
MKNIQLSIITLMALSTLTYGGGDFQLITPYEEEDTALIESVPVEEVVIEEEVIVEPKKIETPPPSAPIVVETAVVEPPKKVVKKDIYANGFYVGLGISTAHYQTNCTSSCAKSGSDTTIGLLARAGYDFNPYIGLEARGLTTSLNDDGGTVKHAGIFVKPMLPIGDKTNIYGLIGLAKTTTQGGLQRTSAETLAMGAGVEVDLSKDSPKDGRYGREFDGKGDQERGLGLFVDYERMVVKSGSPDLDALSAGVTYDF